jgi:hypothetical membrane protein
MTPSADRITSKTGPRRFAPALITASWGKRWHARGQMAMKAETSEPAVHVVPLALTGVIAPILFMIVVTIASSVRPDYSQIRDPISDLGNGPRAWIQNANFALFGALMFCFAIAFRRGMGSIVGRRTLLACTILLGLSAIGFLAAAYFRVPDAAAPEALRLRQGMLHGMSFMLIFVPLILTLVLAGSQMLRRRTWRGAGWYSLATAAVAMLLIALIMQFASPDSPVLIGGLLTRLLVVQTFAWHVFVGWRLSRRRWNGEGHVGDFAQGDR